MYSRIIQKQVEKWLGKSKILILYGARQVGKTTLSKTILQSFGQKGRYINCELPENKEVLENRNPDKMKSFFGGYQLVVLDEAQTVQNIGLTLKILADTFPEIQIIATGSSSFELANKVNEPLTGRSINFMLFPLSIKEIGQKNDALEIYSKLENLLIFGSYPEVFDQPESIIKEKLNSIASNYLYKDILAFEEIRKSSLLNNLLKLLALQVGNEVSIHELAVNLKTSSQTVERYLELLEQTFIIFKLSSFSRNLRKEITKSFKVFFYDLGVRNSIINNFNPLSLRNDVGALWENFLIAERVKQKQNQRLFKNLYFWRTYDQKEIDLVEEYNGELHGYEFKWSEKKKTKIPKLFLETYPNSSFEVVSKDNWLEFVQDSSE